MFCRNCIYDFSSQPNQHSWSSNNSQFIDDCLFAQNEHSQFTHHITIPFGNFSCCTFLVLAHDHYSQSTVWSQFWIENHSCPMSIFRLTVLGGNYSCFVSISIEYYSQSRFACITILDGSYSCRSSRTRSTVRQTREAGLVLPWSYTWQFWHQKQL